MSTQNLIIYKFSSLYHIIEELGLDLNFKTSFADNEKSLKDKVKNHKNYLIISNKKYLNLDNYFVLENTPTKIFKLIEKINIEFLKFHYSKKSELKVGKYKINLNSRELIDQDKILKLTEKEIKIIMYLIKTNKPVSVNELQSEVWGYHSDIETHTVETHVYRLREKVLKNFENKNFILSEKKGYKINLQ